MTRIRVFDGQDKIDEIQLEGELVTVGRDEANQLVLPDPSVSRRHAQIERTGNFFLIRDKGSTNGTFVNDIIAHVQLLRHADVIRVGKYLLRVEARCPPDHSTTRVRVNRREAPVSAAPADEDEVTQVVVPERTVSLGLQSLRDVSRTGVDLFLRLKQFHNRIGHVHGERELLAHALELVLSELDADRAAVLLAPRSGALDEAVDASRLRTTAAARRDGTPREEEEIVIDDAYLQTALESRGAIVYQLPGTKTSDTAMLAPLLDRGTRLGLIYVDRAESSLSFTDNDRLFLIAIADELAISLANARLFEEACSESEKIQAIFTSISDGVLVTDTEFRVTDANIGATVLLGLHAANPIGEDLFEILSAFQISPDRYLIAEEAASQGAIFQVSSLEREPDGAEWNFDGRIVPFPRGSAIRKGFVVTLRDATQYRRMEQLKSEFIGNVAHKLRTPLTVIEANLALLASATGNDESRDEILKDLERNSHQLCHLVDQFVDFADTELQSVGERQLPLLMRPKDLIKAARKRKVVPAGKRGIDIEDLVPESLPAVSVRPSRVLDALDRILDNSLKFSDEGGRVRLEGEVAGQSVKLHVIDDGPGIPSEQIEAVFYLGHQVDEQNTGQVPGAGLGLTIARHIVQEHGGEIRITSPYGHADRGTRVSVVLPLKPAMSGSGPSAADDSSLYELVEAHHAGQPG